MGALSASIVVILSYHSASRKFRHPHSLRLGEQNQLHAVSRVWNLHLVGLMVRQGAWVLRVVMFAYSAKVAGEVDVQACNRPHRPWPQSYCRQHCPSTTNSICYVIETSPSAHLAHLAHLALLSWLMSEPSTSPHPCSLPLTAIA